MALIKECSILFSQGLTLWLKLAWNLNPRRAGLQVHTSRPFSLNQAIPPPTGRRVRGLLRRVETFWQIGL